MKFKLGKRTIFKLTVSSTITTTNERTNEQKKSCRDKISKCVFV